MEDGSLDEPEPDLGVFEDQGTTDEIDGGMMGTEPEAGREARATDQGCSAVFDISDSSIPWSLTLGMLLVGFCRTRCIKRLGRARRTG